MSVYFFSSLFAMHSRYMSYLYVAQNNAEHLVGNSCLQSNYDCSGYEFRIPNQTCVFFLTSLFHSQIKLIMRFEVLIEVNVKITVFWDVYPTTQHNR
jgi:hypothetical protein